MTSMSSMALGAVQGKMGFMRITTNIIRHIINRHGHQKSRSLFDLTGRTRLVTGSTRASAMRCRGPGAIGRHCGGQQPQRAPWTLQWRSWKRWEGPRALLSTSRRAAVKQASSFRPRRHRHRHPDQQRGHPAPHANARSGTGDWQRVIDTTSPPPSWSAEKRRGAMVAPGRGGNDHQHRPLTARPRAPRWRPTPWPSRHQAAVKSIGRRVGKVRHPGQLHRAGTSSPI